MKPILPAVSLALALVAGSPALAQAASTSFSFDLPGGDLKSTSEKIAATFGGDVIFDAYAARGAQTHPVHGQMSVDSALQQALAGTDLTYRYDVAAKRVVISKRR